MKITDIERKKLHENVYMCISEHTFHAENFSDTNIHTGRKSPQQSKIQTSYINCTHMQIQTAQKLQYWHWQYCKDTNTTFKYTLCSRCIANSSNATQNHAQKKIIKICINKNTIQETCGRLSFNFPRFLK